MFLRARQPKKLISTLIKLALFGTSCSLYAGDFQLNSSVESTTYLYETKRNTETEFKSNQALVIKPQLASAYTSKRLQASVLAEHTFVEQKDDAVDGTNKNFTDLRYNSQLTLIENSMYLGIQGSRNYRVLSQIQTGIGDKLLSPGELTKYRQNGANLSFSIPNPQYLGLSFQTNYSETKTDESLNSLNGIDTNNVGSSVSLYQGNKARGYHFNLSAQKNKSDRSNFSNFNSTAVNGLFGLSIGNNTDFVITGNLNEYDVDKEKSTSSRTQLDTNSYGAGFEWTPSAGRSFRLTYNELDQLDRKTRFVGVNTNWAFSTRTIVSLDIGKEFYGKTYNFSLSQNLRNFRVKVNYNESVTSYSFLNTDSVSSLFVCSIGAIELADCFQPDSSTYELQIGETFLPVSGFETNITEEVFLRKSGNMSIGYDKRKFKASITANYGKTEYLESDRELANRSFGFNTSYQLGRKTDVSLSTNISRRSTPTSTKDDTTKSVQLSFNRDLNQQLKLDITARILDRESELLIRDYTDRRLTAGLNYTF